MPYEPKACLVCEKTYTPKRADGRYCSAECHRRRPRGITKDRLACEVCAAPFLPTYRDQRTCGRECGKWLNHKLVCAVEWMNCGICARPYANKAGRGFGTCSPSCADEARRLLFAPTTVRDDSWKYEERDCPRCGVTFRLVDRGIFMAPQTIHCSTRCSRKTAKLKRRVRESGSAGEWRWSDFMRIARKFNYCCAYCGEKPERLDPDHVIPLARGGPNTTSNLLPTCPPCNSDKTDSLLDEWAERRAATGKPPRRTSWAEEDPRYFHLTAVRSTAAPQKRRSAA